MSQGSGSTVLGVGSAVVALFFVYMALTRLWWALGLGVADDLLLGLTYLVIAVVFSGGAVYGIVSKEAGVETVGSGSIFIGGLLFLIALYYWIQGRILNGSTLEIFNALGLMLGGVVLFVVGFFSLYLGRKLGVIEET